LYGICHLSLIPCRKDPSDRSELVTQLLFGETFSILESAGSWTRIKAAADGYEGWIDTKQYSELGVNAFNALSASPVCYTTELVQILRNKRNDVLPLLLGSSLPGFNKGECFIGKELWTYEGQFNVSDMATERSNLIETAHLYLHSPYLWGGRSPFGIDCSGFTQMVYKLNGKRIHRDACQQAEEGSLLSFVEEAQPGDLAFFDNAEGKIIHVGIILNASRIIHASGCVRVDKFDHHGIFREETKKYSHNLRMIRTYL